MAVYAFLLTSQDTRTIPLVDNSSLDDAARQVPAGLYTTFRTFENGSRVLGLRWHLQRLYGPARQQGITLTVSEECLRARLAELLSGLTGEARVRLVLTLEGEIYVFLEPFQPLPPEVYSRGVRVITVALHRHQPSLKKTAFIQTSQQARQRLRESGAFEALMVNEAGQILEGLTSNFFYVGAGWLGTARRGVLPGVTRRVVLYLARNGGVEVRYQPLPFAEVTEISEAFLTSSSRGIVPIVQIDASRVGEGQVGKVTRRFMAAYEAYVRTHTEPIVPPAQRERAYVCSKIS